MTEKIVSLVAAQFPLSGVVIDPPLPVECVQNSTPIKKGERAYIVAVLSNGKVQLGTAASLGVQGIGNSHEMGRFVELKTVTTPPKAGNDNGTK